MTGSVDLRGKSKTEIPTARRFSWAALAGVASVALGSSWLWIHALGSQSLGFDEGLSIAFASRPLSQLMHTLIYEDLHPPLHYLLLHF